MSVISPVTPVSSTNKTGRHNITEILLKVALNTINQFNLKWMDFYLAVPESIGKTFILLHRLKIILCNGSTFVFLRLYMHINFLRDRLNNWLMTST
jgi:hypothetical protein